MPQFSIQNYSCKDLRMYGRIPGRKDNRNYPRMCPDKGQRSKGTKGHDVSTKRENVNTETKYRKQEGSLAPNSTLPEMEASWQQRGAAGGSQWTCSHLGIHSSVQLSDADGSQHPTPQVRTSSPRRPFRCPA